MRKIYILLGFLITLSLNLTCESLKLTEKEAMDLIRNEMSFPKSVAINIVIKPEINTGLCLEYIRLINEGYLKVAEYEMECLKRGKLVRRGIWVYTLPEITEKGRSLIQYTSFTGKDEIEFSPYVLMFDIKKIDEILYDKVNNLALVTYSYGYIPTDYFFKLREIDKDLIDESTIGGSHLYTFKTDFGGEKKAEITLKKFPAKQKRL